MRVPLGRPRVTRGLVGDPAGRLEDAFGHYRFEFRAPAYDWSVGGGAGELLVAWGRRCLAWARARLRRDAESLDVTVGLLMSAANHELDGLGARDFDTDGSPLWREGEVMRLWGMSRTYSLAEAELLARLEEVGENTIGRTLAEAKVHVKDTKPIFLRPALLAWRVITEPLDLLGAAAREFFMSAESRKRRRIIRKIASTKDRGRRSRAAKLGWRRRRRRERLGSGRKSALAKPRQRKRRRTPPRAK